MPAAEFPDWMVKWEKSADDWKAVSLAITAVQNNECLKN
jgi:hypothetical protein